jgi:hypothetical protein
VLRREFRLGTTVLLLVAGAAAAQLPPLPNVGPPLLLRLEGVLAISRQSAEELAPRTASLGLDGIETIRWLAVERARTVGGDQPLDGADVLGLVAPFTPNLLVRGPADTIARLRAASDGDWVRLEGLVEGSSRTYYLRRLDLPDTPR